MTLRAAVGFSAAFHVILLTAAPAGGWLAAGQKRFEVSYLPARPVSAPPPAAAVKPQPLPVPQPRIPDPVAAAPVASMPRVLASEPAPVPAPRPVIRPARLDDVAVPVLRPVISSLPDKEFLFLDHKERVRYPASLSDGSVRLRLILGPEGSFKQAVVLETSDPRLAGLAVKDAQSATPYPRLPAKFRPRQLRYEFLVRYKPE